MSEPTEKQLKYAIAIARELGINLPKERTKQSLYQFIKENKPAFDETYEQRCIGHDFNGERYENIWSLSEWGDN